MPKVRLPLPDVYESVTRRVAVDVTAQLARLMGLPEKTQVYLPGANESVPMNDAQFGSCCMPNLHYPGESKIVMRFSTEVDDSTTLVTPVKNNEQRPLFHDAVHGITVRPIYRYQAMICEIEYTSPNITQARRWLHDMRDAYSEGRGEQYLDLEYHYTLPKGLVFALKGLHDTQESSAWPTGEVFEAWILKFLREGTYPKSVETLIGTDNQIAIPEHQYEVLGWFDFTTTPPEPVRDSSEVGSWTTTFSYRMQYAEPYQVFASWPITVNQKAVPKNLRLENPYDNYRDHTRKVSRTKEAFDEFLHLQKHPIIPYVVYPNFDDWYPDGVSEKDLTLFQGLLMLKKDNLRSLCDLANLGTVRFTPFFLEYFFHQKDRLLNSATSIFDFRLYRGDELVRDVKLSMAPNSLTIQTDKDLDPTYFYHIHISLKRNWYRVDRKTLMCLRRYPTVLYWSLKALGVTLAGVGLDQLPMLAEGYQRLPSDECPGEGVTICRGDPNPLLGWMEPGEIVCDIVKDTGIVKEPDLDDALKDLDDKTDGFIDRNLIGPVTVLYAEILTFKK